MLVFSHGVRILSLVARHAMYTIYLNTIAPKRTQLCRNAKVFSEQSPLFFRISVRASDPEALLV